ncbi:response regulator [Cohnella thailandensis]|uniref:Response regulator n=1 Tax=Cohnella thailandensis TaxID=557557 RepID=A0A841SUB4_9BACL|nr:response regulator [Cohnella thailandensis]MBB6634842.1 response regulator [Cohnella thailandensis]MBP1975937.1 two-component SAPR family response regulator [Cohnella thailandensis]
MIRVIAVDDELPALNRLGKLLQTMEGVQVAGLFDSPKSLLEYALTHSEPVELALLDMEMPGLHGLELARRLQAVRPEIHIAFLTAYEEYAREAFDVEALDYLLKPITGDDLARTLGRLRKRNTVRDPSEEASERKIAVRSFGPFSVTTETGESVRFRNSKSRELLAYLHHHGDKPVSKAQILEDIWQGGDVERAQVNLHSTVYQLRKDLEACGLNGIVEQTKTAGGSYGLRWNKRLDDDVLRFEAAVRQVESTSSLTNVLQAIQLYGDGYLAGSGYGWAAPRQAELELTFGRLLEAMVGTYVEQKRYEIALNPMQKWVQLQPLDAKLHARMIALLLLLDREKEAKKYWETMFDLLDLEEDSGELDWSRLRANPAACFERP